MNQALLCSYQDEKVRSSKVGATQKHFQVWLQSTWLLPREAILLFVFYRTEGQHYSFYDIRQSRFISFFCIWYDVFSASHLANNGVENKILEKVTSSINTSTEFTSFTGPGTLKCISN
ncbi:hypothetical protein XELAEV_18009402mg [Xenopus laevis]|uniref:Uncharacterized protein n=1 Tax=Xenopus laevis TaxID=8355 RepID=A0A974I0S3_XENLA|nr:hypothetical protein XELAEV_18009402mg [Xenopus laevis]